MATYKVIQDIEAEDKLIGPFTFMQFVYIGIVLILGFIAYMLGKANLLLALPFVPPMLFFGALAAPLSGAQSTEVWLLAKIRFLIKPRKRLWNQDGVQQLVTITAPKKQEKHLTDDLSQTEVKSRLSALASTLDTRGWAVKYASGSPAVGGDDRLVDASNIGQPEPVIADNTEDVMDETNSEAAQKLQNMLQQSDATHKQKLREQVQHPESATTKNSGSPDYWFMSQQPQGKGSHPTTPVKTVVPGSDENKANADDKGAEEQALLDKIHREKANPAGQPHKLKTLQPISDGTSQQVTATTPTNTPQTGGQNQTNPDILRLAGNNDLNVSTLARQANKKNEGEDGEVVISLH